MSDLQEHIPSTTPAITPAEAKEALKRRSKFLSTRPKKTKKAKKTGDNIVHKNTDKLFTDIRDKIVKQLADKFELDIAEIQRIINIRTFNKLTDEETVIRFEYLKEYSKNQTDIKKQERFNGFGNSVIIQGAGLMIFDLAMTILNNRNRKKHLDPFLKKASISFSGNYIKLGYRFN
jgi:hypothetical protein